jgi:inosose dehydratase
MIRVACQTYTWEMLGAAWNGRVVDLLSMVAAAGYEGIEITNTMIREMAGTPAAFRAELAARGLTLACFAYAATGFANPAALGADLEGLRKVAAFLQSFDQPRIGLGGAAADVSGTAARRAALDQALRFYEQAGKIGRAAGIPVNVHPHSHFGSLLESAEEYRYLLSRLDPSEISFGPDTGHIVRGGQDLLACLREHRLRITHLHLKDATADRTWALMGKGTCDFPGVLALLAETGYDGWVVAEEESEAARRDGAAAIAADRAYLRGLGY